MCYLQHKQNTGSSEAQRTNLPTSPRTSKMHSRRKRRFWQSSSIFQMHLTRSEKRDFLVKLLRAGVRHKMYTWIQHFVFAGTARVKLDGIFSKKAFMKEYLGLAFCLPHCSWSTSTISLPLYQRGSQTRYIQLTWQSGMCLNTPPPQPTESKKPSIVSINT